MSKKKKTFSSLQLLLFPEVTAENTKLVSLRHSESGEEQRDQLNG